MLPSSLSFTVHQVVMLLNICQSAPGEPPTPPPPPGRWIVIGSQQFLLSQPAELISNACLFDETVT